MGGQWIHDCMLQLMHCTYKGVFFVIYIRSGTFGIQPKTNEAKYLHGQALNP